MLPSQSVRIPEALSAPNPSGDACIPAPSQPHPDKNRRHPFLSLGIWRCSDLKPSGPSFFGGADVDFNHSTSLFWWFRVRVRMIEIGFSFSSHNFGRVIISTRDGVVKSWSQSTRSQKHLAPGLEYRTGRIFLVTNDIPGWWLSLPLWKILVNGMDYPIYYGKMKNVPNHQPGIGHFERESVQVGTFRSLSRFQFWGSGCPWAPL